jgi:cellulose synthase/poly-beta-1,6-N-acetylglucosamine synthase-like glycosyltransferase/peptidoglycan/xylan/chitin deacetylase (PgdA/CDA1 family)/spore germination protein YaaH
MGNGGDSPVFYDPRHRRWRRFKTAVQIASAALTIVLAALVLAVLVNPVLPALGLAPARALPQPSNVLRGPAAGPPLPDTARGFRSVRSRLTGYLDAARRRPPPRRSAAPAAAPRLIAFYVNWDDTSYSSLKENLSRIDELVPEWLHLADGSGAIAVDDPAKTSRVLAFLRSQRPDLRVAPLVNNFDSAGMRWESEKLAAMLADPVRRSRAIEGLLGFVRRERLSGISVDFEEVPAKSHRQLVSFVEELSRVFHAAGLEVSQSVPLDDPAFDYRDLARADDFLILMAYDEHWGDGAPGPVASQGWFARGLARRFAELPANRLVIGIGNYGYDWTEGATESAAELSFQDAIRAAQESDAVVSLDPASLNPGFSYTDENGRPHRVWYLDAVTAFNELVETRRYSPRALALWRLGAEDPSVWSALARRAAPDASPLPGLRRLHYGYDVDYEGSGEVLRVTATPKDGEREIVRDAATGLIASERLLSFPSPYVIERWGGAASRKIALTFDDGPDATYTPAVLDILRREKAPATFFVIGWNGDVHSRLLRRIVSEGHEIGNHTFTHPNIARIRPRQLALEINATERLFESRLGVRSLLFRPPYAEDVEPERPDQVQPLLYTSALGYYTIGMQIDPSDWQRPGVDAIVSATLRGAENGAGHVVLLHDGGGDRGQTVAALPAIIEGLRARGFELVTISDLLGLPHAAVMPPVPSAQRWEARLDDAAFLLLSGASALLRGLFVAGTVLGIGRLLLIGTLAVLQKLRSRRRPDAAFEPAVSVVVPAYNEEKVIGRTVRAVLGSDYPDVEVIVVDDGSTDGTFDAVIREFGADPRVRAFRRPNGGKPRALNYGIGQARGEIVVALDADTIFRPAAIRRLAARFADPRVGAVAGNARVGNRVNLMTNLQALEYVTSQNLDRRAFDLWNCITVVPGAIGAWRRDLVVAAGGFASDTLAEDADLTLAILARGRRIEYEDRAVALTEAPDTLRGFLKQRFRWMYGTLQTAWKHRRLVFRRGSGALGWLALPNVFVFQVLFPLVSPVMDLVMAASLALAAWQERQHPDQPPSGQWKTVLFYYALFLAVDLAASVLAFVLERKEEWKLLAWLFLQRLLYRQLMYVVAVRSVLTAVKGPVVGWGKLERKATVTEGAPGSALP